MDLRKQVFKVPQVIPKPNVKEDDDSCDPSTSGAASDEAWRQYWDQAQDVHVPGRGTFRVYLVGSEGPVVFCIHGGGYTGLTWSLMAAHLKDKYRVVAPDLRGHGASTTPQDEDLSIETMSADVVALWQQLYGSSPERVPSVLVGHSMGGAVAVHAGTGKQIAGLEGVVVVDVVEGTALAALPAMDVVLSNRPQHFNNCSEAISWALRSGMSKSKVAAAVSLPSQLVPDGAGSLCWRTPLAQTRPYWEGWYTGMSDKFLGLAVPKMLLLAGTDRLDRSLTIGQMQGKFQLVLMPTAGHAIQEDEPEKTADHVRQFLTRFRVGQPPLVFPKAGQGVRPVLPVVAGPLHEGSK